MSKLYSGTGVTTTGEQKVDEIISDIYVGVASVPALADETLSVKLKNKRSGTSYGWQKFNLLSLIAFAIETQGAGAVKQITDGGLFYCKIPINLLGAFGLVAEESLAISLDELTAADTYELYVEEAPIIPGMTLGVPNDRLLMTGSKTEVSQAQPEEKISSLHYYTHMIVRDFALVESVEMKTLDGQVMTHSNELLHIKRAVEDDAMIVGIDAEGDAKITSKLTDVYVFNTSGLEYIKIFKATTAPVRIDFIDQFAQA